MSPSLGSYHILAVISPNALIFLLFRNSGYNHDELLGSLYDNGRATIDATYYDLPVHSQPELIKHDILEALGHKDISSLPDFSSDNILRASSGLSFAREEPKLRNIPPLQSDMVILLAISACNRVSFHKLLHSVIMEVLLLHSLIMVVVSAAELLIGFLFFD